MINKKTDYEYPSDFLAGACANNHHDACKGSSQLGIRQVVRPCSCDCHKANNRFLTDQIIVIESL